MMSPIQLAREAVQLKREILILRILTKERDGSVFLMCSVEEVAPGDLCYSQNILIQTRKYPHHRLHRSTTGPQVHIIWIVLLCLFTPHVSCCFLSQVQLWCLFSIVRSLNGGGPATVGETISNDFLQLNLFLI